MKPRSLGVALVALQIGFCLAIILPGWRGVVANAWLWPGILAGVGLSASGVWAMRATGVRLTPEPGREARLCEDGIYRHIRHPMYAGLLLAMAMFAAGGGSFAWVAWAGLLAVLVTKLRIEERLWSERDPAYLCYRARTKRLIPGLW